jgi:hypothetical protein
MLQKLQKDQALMTSKLEGRLDKIDGRLEKIEGVILEVKKSNRHADQQPRQEPYQESGTASGSNARNTHLRFLNGLNLKTPIYTEKKIIAESNSAIRIGIFDADNKMIREGPLSKVKSRCWSSVVTSAATVVRAGPKRSSTATWCKAGTDKGLCWGVIAVCG